MVVAAVSGPDAVREALLNRRQGRGGWAQLVALSERWGGSTLSTMPGRMPIPRTSSAGPRTCPCPTIRTPGTPRTPSSRYWSQLTAGSSGSCR